jgi:TorA maturation chaperone TorD
MTLIQEDTTMTTLDSISTFTGEVLVFKLLGRLFYEYPEPGWIQYLADERIFDEIPFGPEQPAMLTGLALLQHWNGSELEAIDGLRADYTRLFIGPAKVLAYPWESVYFNDERLTFQTETLQVRNWYRRFGLATADLYREPDDHAGLELDFLSHLAQLGLTAAEDGDTARLDEIVDAQRQFFTAHAARWIPSLCDLMITHARTDFYRGVAWITKGALAELANVLGVPFTIEVKK